MAVGDAAAAAGLTVFPDTQDINQGANNDNIRGDELAEHMTSGTHPWGKITGKPKTYPAQADSVGPAQLKDGAVRTEHLRSRAVTTDKLALGSVYGGIIGEDAITPGHLTDNCIRTRHILNRQVDTDQLAIGAVYGGIIDDGAIEWGHLSSAVQNRIDSDTSSRRYKEDIIPADVDLAAVLSLEPVTYHRKSALPDERELGLIAEDVDAAGVHDLVVWRNGHIDGLRYDRLAVALLAVVQDQSDRLAALEATVAALAATPTDPDQEA